MANWSLISVRGIETALHGPSAEQLILAPSPTLLSMGSLSYRTSASHLENVKPAREYRREKESVIPPTWSGRASKLPLGNGIRAWILLGLR